MPGLLLEYGDCMDWVWLCEVTAQQEFLLIRRYFRVFFDLYYFVFCII